MQSILSNINRMQKQNYDSNQDIINVRDDIIGELDAINQYTQHIDNTTDPRVRRVLTDIRSEEEIHVGQLMNLLFTLNEESRIQFEKGIQESNEQINR